MSTATANKPTKRELPETEINETKKQLLSILGDNRTIYTSIKRVSSSGMSRHIALYIAKDNEIIDITWYAIKILGWKRNADTGGLVVGGCGMDMGFHTVYTLSRMLFPEGFKLPKGKYGRNGDNSGYDTDGGYALKQEWI